MTNEETQHAICAGSVIGMWTIISQAERKHYKSRWKCRCECGTESIVWETNLKRRLSTGCKPCSNSRKPNYHGMSESKTYSVYVQMLERCNNKKHKFYPRYGGRGITVCDSWNSSFNNFVEDMGLAPKNLTLDRIDNEKGYSKSNCRWATRKEQSNNRQISIHIGEINNGWKVVERLPQKTLSISCTVCQYIRPVRSCNFRRLGSCKLCKGEK